MNYKEQLDTSEWKSLRRSIIERDNCHCQKCLNKNIITDATMQKVSNVKKHENLAVLELYNGSFKYLPYSDLVTNKKIDFLSSFLLVYQKINEGHENVVAIQLDIKREMEFYNEMIKNSKKNTEQLKKKIEHEENLLNISPTYYSQKKEDLKRRLALSTNNLNSYYSKLKKEYNENEKWVSTFGLNVHHKYYQEEKKAWEYNEEALITVCETCHKEIHATTKIPLRNKNGNEVKNLTPCSRCGGAGIFEAFLHIENGICFRCRGVQYEEFISI